MDDKNITREQMSAFSDGELESSQIEAVLIASHKPDGRDAWEVYHQIGDLLRSDELDVTLSPAFAARMAAKLDAEPTMVAPVVSRTKQAGVESKVPVGTAIKRFAIPGVAAAALAIAAVVTTPQLMIALDDVNSLARPSPSMAVADSATSQVMVVPATAPPQTSGMVTPAVNQEVVLRDPRIDEYLMAHQRFSPSVYSTAQYARSATFPTDSDK